MREYYVLQIIGDVEPVIHGPFDCEADRDSVALSLRAQDDGDLKDGLYPMEIDDCYAPHVDTYSGAFFDQVDDEASEQSSLFDWMLTYPGEEGRT